jgi:hypothetical protein
MLRLYILETLNKDHAAAGVPHVVSYRNTDRLKRETAFHNPGNKTPDGILNDILDDYFHFVAKIRKK